MYKTLNHSKIFFVFSVFCFLFFLFYQDSLAVDSTAVSGMTSVTFNTSAGQKSFILYENRKVIANEDEIDTFNVDIDKTCPTGMAACASSRIDWINHLNAQECYFQWIGSIAGIGKLTTGYRMYIWFLAETEAPTNTSPCDDRGGVVTNTITCVPADNVGSEAFSTSTGLGLGSGAIGTWPAMCVK